MTVLSWKKLTLRAGNGARKIAAGVLLTGLIFGTGAACGGAGAPAQAPVDMSSLKPAPDSTIFIQVESASSEANPFAENVRSQLVASFASAGYKLVESKQANPDVVARVTVSAVEETSMFQTQVNGQVQKSYTVTLNASLLASSDAAVIDQTESSFSGEGGKIDKSACDRLVFNLNKSGKLETWAKNIEKGIEKAEDDLWTAGNVEGCKNAKTKEACDGIETYLKKYPTGKHAAEARQAIEDGKVAFQKAQDEAQAADAAEKEEAAWKAAVVDQCKKPTKSYDCSDVEAYLRKYPTGKYAAEAKTAMKESEKQREALKKKEDAVKKSANRAECIKDCRRYYEKYYAYEILAQRCIQNECN
ncbi:MAG: hypothetical protein AB7K71_29765 [Polyangiaceae bacterium]